MGPEVLCLWRTFWHFVRAVRGVSFRVPALVAGMLVSSIPTSGGLCRFGPLPVETSGLSTQSVDFRRVQSSF